MQAESKGQPVDRDQVKLDLLMNEDPLISKLYREVLGQIKSENEAEEEYLKTLHKNFDSYLNPDIMAKKLGTEYFDAKAAILKDDIEYSTEFTDFEEEVVYRRYKELKKRNYQEYKDVVEKMEGNKIVYRSDEEVEEFESQDFAYLFDDDPVKEN